VTPIATARTPKEDPGLAAAQIPAAPQGYGDAQRDRQSQRYDQRRDAMQVEERECHHIHADDRGHRHHDGTAAEVFALARGCLSH